MHDWLYYWTYMDDIRIDDRLLNKQMIAWMNLYFIYALCQLWFPGHMILIELGTIFISFLYFVDSIPIAILNDRCEVKSSCAE